MKVRNKEELQDRDYGDHLSTEQFLIILASYDNTEIACHRVKEITANLLKGEHEDIKTTLVIQGQKIDTSSENDISWEKLNVVADMDFQESMEVISIADQLHAVADSLPKYGAIVDIIWCFPEMDQSFSVEKELMLYGSLKRLIEWHRAHITMVSPTGSEPSHVQKDWAELLKASCTSSDKLTGAWQPVKWRGSILINSKDYGGGISLGGFQTRPRKLNRSMWISGEETSEFDSFKQLGHLSSYMEMLGEVAVTQIPSLLLTNHCFNLEIPSSSGLLKKSQFLLNRLCKTKKNGYLLRVRYGSTWPTDSKKSIKNDWRKLVTDNLANVNDSQQHIEPTGDLRFHHFLLTLDASNTLSSPPYLLCLFRKSSEISGRLQHIMSQQELTAPRLPQCINRKSKGRKKAREMLQELPSLNGDCLKKIEENLQILQTKILQRTIDDKIKNGESKLMKAGEVVTLLKLVRNLYLPDVLHDLPKHRTRHTGFSITPPLPECCGNTETELERLVLAKHNQEQKQLNRQKSSDSLASLGPPKGEVVMLDVSEFLKFFKSDGSAAKEPLSQINSKKLSNGKLYQHDSEEAKKSQWPESAKTAFHDIYYHHDNDDAFEKSCQKLKSRMHTLETASTCTIEQAHSPAAITVLRDVTDSNTEHNERKQRSRAKRGREEQTDSKSLYQAKKRKLESQKTAEDTRSMRSDARSQASSGNARNRNKKLLEEAVKTAVTTEGVQLGDKIYSSCFLKLYNLSRTFVNDIIQESRSIQELRNGMEQIALNHAKQVITFEKARQEKLKKQGK